MAQDIRHRLEAAAGARPLQSPLIRRPRVDANGQPRAAATRQTGNHRRMLMKFELPPLPYATNAQINDSLK
jgi:hypothetical protein